MEKVLFETWEPHSYLLKDENFIKDMPHGCDCCAYAHSIHTTDWECFCSYCTQRPDNWYENEMRALLIKWKEQGEPIRRDGSIGIYTKPCLVYVLVVSEFGLQFSKGDDCIVQRNWDDYKLVVAYGRDVPNYKWSNVIHTKGKYCVVMTRVPMETPSSDADIRYYLVKDAFIKATIPWIEPCLDDQ